MVLRLLAATLAAAHVATTVHAANPVGGATPAGYVPGMADPNLHFFNGSFYMFATHDFAPNNTGFLMRDWWVWSSADLIAWELESIVTPQESLKWDTVDNECWATDAAFVDGKFYFCET